jgi:ubiquinone/menaquinone biosynthesis C-methylase UbiE
MAVHLNLDTKELANFYDEKNESPYISGCALLEKLKLQPGWRILDVGCGTGRLGRSVMELIGGAGYFIGIDPMVERIRLATEKNRHPNAVFRVGRAEDLSPIKDNSVDVVYLNWVFHWVTGKEAALSEIFRVLKPGGKAGITLSPKELNTITGLNSIFDDVLSRPPYRGVVRLKDAPQYLHGVTTTELIKLLTKAGLQIADIHIELGKRTFSSVSEIIGFYEAGLFGNFLNHVPDGLRAQAKSDIEKELATYQTKNGLQFDYYTIFAIAQKASGA